jgi:hypothetical protein
VVAWGNNGEGQAPPVVTVSAVTAIAAGGYHTVALKQDGTVVAWGNNDYGQTTVPPGLSGVAAIAAGVYYTLALKRDGTIVAWGDNSAGQGTVFPVSPYDIPVSGSVTYDQATAAVTVAPAALLALDTVYHMAVTGVRNQDGLILENPATWSFTTAATAPTLAALTITGPTLVPESATAFYAATASWSDGTTSGVVPTWSVTPTTYATISNSGDLVTQAIPANQNITIVAEYALGGITRTATRAAVISNTANYLGVTLGGNGIGTLQGRVGTDIVIDCTTPSSGSCLSSLPVGSSVHLSARPDPDSVFAGWGSQCGVCTGASCLITVDRDKTCSASFIILLPTRIGGVQYPSLKAAYLAASTTAIIQSKATTFSGGLLLDRGIAVTLRGGYDAGYSTQTGYSLVEGKLTVATGSVVVDRLVIR